MTGPLHRLLESNPNYVPRGHVIYGSLQVTGQSGVSFLVPP